MKKILIILLSFLLVGCGPNKQIKQGEEFQENSTKEEVTIASNDKNDSIDIYLNESNLKYSEITFCQDYIINQKNIMNSNISETDSIDGIEINGLYDSEVPEAKNIKQDSVVNIYLPSEINGKSVVSIVGLLPYFGAITNLHPNDYYTNVYLPDSTLLVNDLSVNNVYANDSLRYAIYCNTLDKIGDNMKYLDGSVYISQKTFDIDDRMVFGNVSIKGQIEEINIDSLFDNDGDIIIGNDIDGKGDFILAGEKANSNINTVNINCSFSNKRIIIISDYLKVNNDISIGETHYLDSNLSDIPSSMNGTIELGKNITSGPIHVGSKVSQYIINDPSNADVLVSDNLNKDDSVINKSGQEVEWNKIFHLLSDCKFVTGRLDWFSVDDGNFYVEVIE